MSQPIHCRNCGAEIGRAHPARPNGRGSYSGYDPPESEFWHEDDVVVDEDGEAFCGQDCHDECHPKEEADKEEGAA